MFIALFFVPGMGVSAAESVESSRDIFRFDDMVEISAPVGGDIYAVGREVHVRGPVEGDVLVLGGTVVIAGAVHGNIRAIGDTVRLQGTVDGNVSIAARALTLDPEAQIAKNLSFLGQFIAIANTIKGATTIALFRSGQTRIQKGAVIEGPVALYASEAPMVDSGALLHTPITRHDALWAMATTGDIIFSRIISFFSLLLIGLVFIHLLPRPSLVIASIMNTKLLYQFLWGLGFLVVPPLVALALAFTVIGIPLAMIVGALWAIIVYSARVFAGLTIGFIVLSRVDRKRRMQSLVVVLFLGTLIFAIAESMPFVGPLVTLLATLWGLGGIMTLLRRLSAHEQKSA